MHGAIKKIIFQEIPSTPTALDFIWKNIHLNVTPPKAEKLNLLELL